jgi:hypothetical protein
MKSGAEADELVEDAGELVANMGDAEIPDDDAAVDEEIAHAQRVWRSSRAALDQTQRDHAARVRAGNGRVDQLSRWTPPRELGPVAVAPLLAPRPETVRMGRPGAVYVAAPPRDTAAEIRRRIRQTLPEKFIDGVTWTTLAHLREEGRSSLGTVLARGGKRLRGAAAVAEIQERMALSRKVVVLGETRAGKTLVTAAAIEGEIQAGNTQARWVNAVQLKEPDAVAGAPSGAPLVIDNLGYELNGAKVGSGWLPGLIAPACDLLDRWYLGGRRLIVTTFLPFTSEVPEVPGMAELYGAGAAARVYESADTIRLFRE